MIPSKNQIVIYKEFKNTTNNINISAVAGSGKTTVLLECLKSLKEGKANLFLAFNNSIVDELKDRNKRADVDIMTIHSYGWRRILYHYGGKVKMNPNKSIAKTEIVLREYKDIKENKKGYFFYIIPKIVDLMRCNLIEPDLTEIMENCDHYNLDVGEREVEMAMKVFKLSVKDKSQYDFMDMIYQPLIDPRIRFKKYDNVFCDESQDFSLAQHEVIRNCLNRKGRLITVGDPNQAIYGFAGADANSYEKLGSINGASVTLPLSVSYRCDRAIVREAQKIVPEISWSPDAEEGLVKLGSLTELKYGDWILCRNLKPLIQTYLWLMKNKIKSKIRGKEIGEGILSLISKTGAKTLSGMMRLLEFEQTKLLKKLSQRGVRKPSNHPKMEILNQKIEVIECLSNEVSTVAELKELISNIFSDEVKGILLTTIHKAKGLENDTIFFLCPELIPSIYAELPWQIEQEYNLKYVGITRARHTLVWVLGNDFKKDIASKIIINK